MKLTIPPDPEALIQKRVACGAFADYEDVLRHALEAQDADESWAEEERQALAQKIDPALAQVAAGDVYSPEEARQELVELRAVDPKRRLLGRR